jgi:hypothetical protein
MRQYARRRLAITGFAAALVAATFLGGAASGATDPEQCNPVGRQFCLTISDEDGVSHSTEAISRHTTFAVNVRNRGATQLNNGTVSWELVDVVGGQEQPSTAAFRSSSVPAGCTLDAPTELTCVIDHLPPGQSVSFGPVPTRTSLNLAATATRLRVTGNFNEGPSDGQPQDPNPDTFVTTGDMVYETSGQGSASVIFDGGSTILDSSSDDDQFSVFKVPVPAGFAGLGLAFLKEFESGETGYFCPAGVTCFGESITTDAPDGIFVPGSPANVLTTFPKAILSAAKVTEKTLKVNHRHDDGSIVQIQAKCSGEIGTLPPLSELPCRRVKIDNQLKLVMVDIYDFDQGNWGMS